MPPPHCYATALPLRAHMGCCLYAGQTVPPPQLIRLPSLIATLRSRRADEGVRQVMARHIRET